jgi:glyoxylase-like metal-dependent hydrolase (beta-lactamase superfamily II)
MSDMTATMRILEPYPGHYAYYDGRIEGKRLHSPEPNWLDDGAYSLGIASYAFVEGAEAIVYDTNMSLEHAKAIRDHIAGLGVTNIRVVLSHWHTDHIAGNEAFADCEIIALELTAEAMRQNREKLETNALPIKPVIMPTRTFEKRLDLMLGNRRLELHHFDIHSADGCVIWLPDEHILLAGDTLEDTVTYVAEPEHIATHVAELSRMATWPIRHILPNHGDPVKIESGGYDKRLIDANRIYLQRLLDPQQLAAASGIALREFVEDEITSGSILYFEPYETVHQDNIDAIAKANAPE